MPRISKICEFIIFTLKFLEDFDANNLIPERSNARIDYEASEDIDNYPISNVGSGQSKLPKFCKCLVY